MTELTLSRAHFDGTASAVVVEELTVRDPDVVREAQRWTDGGRGPIVDDPDVLARADLTDYVTEALRLGAHAMSVTGQAQESRALDQMLQDVGEKTAQSTHMAAEATGRAAQAAAEAVGRAASEAKKAITEADAHSRRELTEAVARAKRDMTSELRQLFGGEHPELLERLNPVLQKFGTELDTKVTARTSELLTKTARQFDPDDPTSPMAKQAAALAAQQKQLTEQLTNNHAALAGKLDELATALKVQQGREDVAKVTPIKGGSYADGVHALMRTIAMGLGDEYTDTSASTGHVARSKKGDGVLTAEAGAARVVVEMTDSTRGTWNEYFDEAERNRGAAASLGLVRVPGQNNEQTIRVIGPRRVVIAFDPETDDPDLLRTAVFLLRTAALAAANRHGEHDITTAQEKINEAVVQLERIDTVKKLAGLIQKNATKIDGECAGLNADIRRLLGEAMTALAGATPAPQLASADADCA